MQVNLNTNIRQSKPQFKAKFADDINTKNILKEILPENKHFVLATHFALNDMETDDQIALRRDSHNHKYYARNLSSDKEVCLSTGNPMFIEGAELFSNIMKKGLIDEPLKHNYLEYINKAIKYFQENFKTENIAINKLKIELNKAESELLAKECQNILKIIHK